MRIHLWCAAAVALALTACSGDNGAAGMDGDSGTQGEPGVKGDDGAKGDTGAKGAPGAKGDDGAMGAKGDTGDDGAKGDKGDTGDTGATGADGNDIILSETAKLGLDISQVPIEGLEGLGGDEIESIGRGAYIVNAASDCIGCHSSGDGFLNGNVPFPFPPIGYDSNNAPCTPGPAGCNATIVYSRNLTPDKTTGLKLTEDQFVEVLRTGRDFKDSTKMTSLLVMPWKQLRWMTERDMRDIYHYLRHIPVADNAVQADKKPKIAPLKYPYFENNGDPIDVPTFADGDVDRDLPAALDFEATPPRPTAAAGELFDTNNVQRGLAISPLDDDAIVAAMSASEQSLYGRGSYIVNGPGLCNECHTPGGRDPATDKVQTAIFLTGGQAFLVPDGLNAMIGQYRTMSGNLIGKDHGFSLAYSMFLTTLSTGASYTKTDHPPHPLGFPMPFETFRNLTNADKEAVYTYISTIQKAGLVTGDNEHQMPARYCTQATEAADCTGTGETCSGTTGACIGGDCMNDGDCGACQTCDLGTKKCLVENASSNCVKFSF